MSALVSCSSINDFNITPKPPALDVFVDHQLTGRSGHLGHTAFQRNDGEIFAFFPNCSSEDPGRHGTAGHSAIGWMEYKRSSDGGITWSPSQPLEYSKQAHDTKKGWSVFTEKAIVTTTGVIVLFHVLCDVEQDALWEPYLVPTSTRSLDGGETWSEPVNVGLDRGRIYGAAYSNGVIYVLKFKNDAEIDFCGTSDEHVYTLYCSKDDGASFEPVSDLPFDTLGRGYGTLCCLPEGRLIAYIYNKNDEEHLEYCLSDDNGLTWSEPVKSFFAKRIRNPQMISFAGGYFLHGRSGTYGPVEGKGHFVLYYSTDGFNWDGGTYLAWREHGQGAYSASLVVKSDGSRLDRLRIQASHAYWKDATNILQWWLEPRP